MEVKWLNPDAKFDRLVLAGDIGGTNTNLGLVGYKDGKFTLILETDCPSKDTSYGHLTWYWSSSATCHHVSYSPPDG